MTTTRSGLAASVFVMSIALVAVSATTAGCTPAVAVCEEKRSLVDVRAWQFVEPGDDVLWPATDGAVLCTADDIQVQPVGDDLALEIDTRLGCGQATTTQPLLEDLRVGDRLHVQVFYFSQTAFPEAEAEVAVAIDGEVVMSERVPIPAVSGLVQPVLAIERDVDAGADVAFHVGNHGDNSWNLVELAVTRDVPCDGT